MCFSVSINGQKKSHLSLLVLSTDSTENKVIKSVKYRKKFSNKQNLFSTRDRVLRILKQNGYFSLTIDSLTSHKNNYKSYVNLGEKIKFITLTIQKADLQIINDIGIKIQNNTIFLPGDKLKSTLQKISDYLIENGESFSEVSIKNLLIGNSHLKANLNIKHSKKRRIDKVIVKGYENFPKTYIKNYFNLNDERTFNNTFIKKILQKTNQLDFTKTIKEPEILFSKDSTILYLYLEKMKSNSFDGLINFNTDDKKIKFQGYVDLKLNNTFNTGEKINLYWRNNGEQKQELSFNTKIPYLLNTKFSTSINFNLFKNDSLFSNIKFDSKISLPIYNNFNILFLFNKETSSTNQTNLELQNFNTTGFGFGFDNTTLNSNHFTFHLNLTLNNQKTTKSNKYYIASLTTNSIFSISRTLNFSLRLKSIITNRKTQMTNELFRSGGMNSIRGFLENSILSNSYSYINSDFIFSKNKKNQIFSIQDFGVFNLNSFNIIKSSIGLGYRQTTPKNQLSIAYIIGDPLKNTITNSSVISIKLLTFF